ncbi:MAG: hypothetical protein MPK62_10330, partial [Alphaproteobacteria bacterium]|nr:hypothetical protein [Alphaproteobacteria bacterium]
MSIHSRSIAVRLSPRNRTLVRLADDARSHSSLRGRRKSAHPPPLLSSGSYARRYPTCRTVCRLSLIHI